MNIIWRGWRSGIRCYFRDNENGIEVKRQRRIRYRNREIIIILLQYLSL